MSGHLGRRRILELFDELSEELRFQGARAQIYIVGGAAMSLAFSRERTTMDVDARIDAGHYRLTDAVRTVGRRHERALSLNDGASRRWSPAGNGSSDEPVRHSRCISAVATPRSSGRILAESWTRHDSHARRGHRSADGRG